jgi:hypothetical protein
VRRHSPPQPREANGIRDQTAAAEFGMFLLKTAMAHMEIRNRPPENSRGPDSSFSLTRQAQTNRYDRRIRDEVRVMCSGRYGTHSRHSYT